MTFEGHDDEQNDDCYFGCTGNRGRFAGEDFAGRAVDREPVALLDPDLADRPLGTAAAVRRDDGNPGVGQGRAGALGERTPGIAHPRRWHVGCS